jgi:hypothetical protein
LAIAGAFAALALGGVVAATKQTAQTADIATVGTLMVIASPRLLAVPTGPLDTRLI